MTAGLAARLGIFARTFPRATPQEVAAAVARAGYPLAHWNFAAIGRATLGGDVDPAQVAAVRRAFDHAGVAIPSVSATFNLIHPDPGRRAAQTTQAVRLIGLVPDLGADAPVGIVLDPANLLSPESVPRQSEVLAQAVALLGPAVIGVQAKDVAASGASAPGAGLLDYPALFRTLAPLPPVPVIVQDTSETDAARVRDDLVRWFAEANRRQDPG